MNKSIFSFLIGTSLLGQQAFAMDLDSDRLRSNSQPTKVSKPDLKLSRASLEQYLGQTNGDSSAVVVIRYAFENQPTNFHNLVQRAKEISPGTKPDLNGAHLILALSELKPVQFEAVIFLAQKFFTTSMYGVEKSGLISLLGELPPKLAHSLEAQVRDPKSKINEEIATTCKGFYPRMDATERAKKILALLKRFDPFSMARIAPERLNIRGPYKQETEKRIQALLDKAPKKRQEPAIATAKKLFRTGMNGHSFYHIMKALLSVPVARIPTVFEDTKPLFTKRMGIENRSSIVEEVGNVPKERIPIVEAEAPKLLKEEMRGVEQTNIIRALLNVPSGLIKKVVSQVKNQIRESKNPMGIDAMGIVMCILAKVGERATKTHTSKEPKLDNSNK